MSCRERQEHPVLTSRLAQCPIITGITVLHLRTGVLELLRCVQCKRAAMDVNRGRPHCNMPNTERGRFGSNGAGIIADSPPLNSCNPCTSDVVAKVTDLKGAYVTSVGDDTGRALSPQFLRSRRGVAAGDVAIASRG